MHLIRAMLAFISVMTALESATSVTRHAITWTFDADYRTGTFVNGDPWVRENTAGSGVTITAISPEPGSGPGGAINGSMINPPADAFAQQGYDARGAAYNESLNVVKNGTADLPLNVPANSSLISSVSLNITNLSQERPVISDASVLTVLPADALPDTGDFRPPYVGTDKSLKWNTGQIDWTRLPAHEPPPQVALIPALASCVSGIERLWLLNSTTGNARDIHPSNNMSEYGRDLSNTLETGLLRSLLDDPVTDKRQLVIQLIQKGLDIAGCVREGIRYYANGGHNQGMKMPLLYAGWLLHDQEIIDMGDKEKYFVFQEDQQTFYVEQADVDDCPKSQANYERECYTVDMLGMPEWGFQHSSNRNYDGSNWGVRYRDVAGTATVGHCLAAILMDLEEQWNWPPFFDYYRTRYYPLGGTMSYFEQIMWIKYQNYTRISATAANGRAMSDMPFISGPVDKIGIDTWLHVLHTDGYVVSIYDNTGKISPPKQAGVYFYSVQGRETGYKGGFIKTD